jgi:phosphoglycerol geranylgeranyltransferase
MKVIEYLRSKVRIEKLHMTLIDPDKLGPEACAGLAFLAYRAGSDAVMIGGSTGIDFNNLDKSVIEMKYRIPIPIIQFPSHSEALSPNVDAIYFMSMLNSREIKFVIGEQMKASRLIKELDIETIPMGYIIVEPGMKVGEMGGADPVNRDDHKTAISYALAAQYLGMKFVYLEAGSGAPSPVPVDMIRAVRDEITIPLVVGGGIRDAKNASEIAEAGADIVVTGTIVEVSEDVEGTLREIVRAVKRGGRFGT